MFGERVSVLLRVSTDQQAQSGLGIDAQKAAVAAKVAQERWEVVKTTTERGVSGKSPLSARQGLTEAMAIVASGQAEILLVAKLCRLSRDPMNSLIIEKTIMKAGGRVVSCAGEGTDSDEPSQVLMRRVMSAVAENEAAMISQRTRVALAAKKARGERLGRPPFGFVVNNGELVPGPLFPELAACCALLGWWDQTEEERTAWTGHPNHSPWGVSHGRGGGMKACSKKHKYMTHRDMADHLTKFHGERTTWSHDKVGRISRRHSPERRKELYELWKNKEEKKNG